MTTPYEVSISCRRLENKDFFSKSDPVAILLESVPNSKRFVELGRTELVKDCLNPKFVKKFRLVDRPGSEDPTLRVAVIDIDDFDHLERLAEQEFIGRADFPQSLLTGNQRCSVPLSGDSGEVLFHTVAYDEALDGAVTLEFANHSFRLKDRAVFLEIHRLNDQLDEDEADSFTLVYRSEQSVTANFEPIKASLFTLALGDRGRRLRFEFWRYCHKGSHTRLAVRDTSLSELEQLYVTENLPLLTFDYKGKKDRQCSLVIKFFDVR